MTSTVAAAQGSSKAPLLVWVGLVIIALLLVLLAFSSSDEVNIGGRADPNGSGPEGMLAARLLVERAGGQTRLDVGVPSEDIDVAILPEADPFFDTGPLVPEDDDDFVIVESWAPLQDWIRDGGILITEQDVPLGPSGTTSFNRLAVDELLIPGDCSISEYSGIENVVPRSFSPVEVDIGSASSCFGDEETALVVVGELGAGLIIRIATLEPFFNRSFGEADNGALFARTIRIDDGPTVGFLPEAPIRFVESEDGEFVLDELPPSGDGDDLGGAEGDDRPASDDFADGGADGSGDGDEAVRGDELGRSGAGGSGLLDLISQEVLALIAGLTAAAFLFAVAKARRLGSPVSEAVPIKLPSSSFVEALGRLYRRAENPTARSASIMRENLRTTLTRRGGMPADTSAAVISETLGPSGADASLVRLLDGPPPASDDEFVALARDLTETRQRIEQHGIVSLTGGVDQTPPDPVQSVSSKGTPS